MNKFFIFISHSLPAITLAVLTFRPSFPAAIGAVAALAYLAVLRYFRAQEKNLEETSGDIAELPDLRRRVADLELALHIGRNKR